MKEVKICVVVITRSDLSGGFQTRAIIIQVYVIFTAWSDFSGALGTRKIKSICVSAMFLIRSYFCGAFETHKKIMHIFVIV